VNGSFEDIESGEGLWWWGCVGIFSPSSPPSLSRSSQRPWRQWTTVNDSIDAIGSLS